MVGVCEGAELLLRQSMSRSLRGPSVASRSASRSDRSCEGGSSTGPTGLRRQLLLAAVRSCSNLFSSILFSIASRSHLEACSAWRSRNSLRFLQLPAQHGLKLEQVNITGKSHCGHWYLQLLLLTLGDISLISTTLKCNYYTVRYRTTQCHILQSEVTVTMGGTSSAHKQGAVPLLDLSEPAILIRSDIRSNTHHRSTLLERTAMCLTPNYVTWFLWFSSFPILIVNIKHSKKRTDVCNIGFWNSGALLDIRREVLCLCQTNLHVNKSKYEQRQHQYYTS